LGSEQEFDEVPNWRGFQDFGFRSGLRTWRPSPVGDKTALPLQNPTVSYVAAVLLQGSVGVVARSEAFHSMKVEKRPGVGAFLGGIHTRGHRGNLRWARNTVLPVAGNRYSESSPVASRL